MRGRRVKWVAAWGRVWEARQRVVRSGPCACLGGPPQRCAGAGASSGGLLGHLGAKRDQRLPPEVIGALRSPPQCHDGGWSRLVVAIRLVKKWD